MNRYGEAVGIAGGGLFMLLGLALSLLNVAAVWGLAVDVWDWHWIGAGVFIGLLFVLRLDIVLAPLALWGMISAWGWAWWVAVLIVFWPVALAIMVGGVEAVFGVVGRSLRRV